MEPAQDRLTQDIVLDDVVNLRDLGGYPTTDGRTVRRGRLYRGAGLQRLAGADLQTVRSLGWATIVDLRTAGEVQRSGTAPAEELGAAFHHLPMIRQVWEAAALDPEISAEAYLSERYQEMLEEGATTLRTAVGLFSHAENLPAVFYCAAGKDRTGMMAAVLLDALAVDHETIAQDYHLSKERVDHIRARARQRQEPTSMVAQPETFMAAPAGAMRRLLVHVSETYGSGAGYLHTIGVAPSELRALRENLTSA